MPTANELPLKIGLEEFTQTYMPAKNLAPRTRNEYQRDLADLVRFLAQRGLTIWQQVNLTDLEYYLAELDQRQLKPASRSRKTYAIKTFFTYLTAFNYLMTGHKSSGSLQQRFNPFTEGQTCLKLIEKE